MANKLTFDMNLFDKYIETFEELGDEIKKQAVKSGLKAAKSKVNEDIKKALIKPNMPKLGKYSTGRSKQHIDKNFTVEKDGMVYSILAGFDWNDRNIGWGTQVMIYGTPFQKPIKGLKGAIYGKRAQKYVAEEVQKAIDKIVERTMNK